jgi:hypothetical protein
MSKWRPYRLCDATPASPSEIVEVKAGPLFKRTPGPTPCPECGRWNYHLATCSRSAPRERARESLAAAITELRWLNVIDELHLEQLELARAREVPMDP